MHSSVGGHLGCFHVLAIAYSVAMNIGVHLSFQIIVFLYIGIGARIVRSYGSSIVTILIYILNNSVRGFPFLPTLSRIYHLQIF